MFESVKNFLGRRQESQRQAMALSSEANQFKIPSEALPQTIKYIFFAGLAVLNYQLFAHAVPGAWGQGIGCIAILSEITAVYSLHYFSRAAGLFRAALGVSGFALMVFALVHATMSVMSLINGADYNIEYYSKVVAFPLLSALVGISVVALCMTHPKNMIRFQQAKAHTDIAVSRAEAASEVGIMQAKAAVEAARLEFHREQNRREEEYLEELERTLQTEARKAEVVGNISNPQLRERIARELGIDVEASQWMLPPSANGPKP